MARSELRSQKSFTVLPFMQQLKRWIRKNRRYGSKARRDQGSDGKACKGKEKDRQNSSSSRKKKRPRGDAGSRDSSFCLTCRHGDRGKSTDFSRVPISRKEAICNLIVLKKMFRQNRSKGKKIRFSLRQTEYCWSCEVKGKCFKSKANK